MSVGLTIRLALAAWALGPLILRCAGGLLTICAAVLWAVPMETHTSTAALAFTAVTGGAMWHTGTIWRARRDVARLGGYRTLIFQQLITRGIVRLRRARNTHDESELAAEMARNRTHPDAYHVRHVGLRHEDVIEGVAYDVDHDARW